MKLNNLANNILNINLILRDNALKAINKSVTARNWLIGYYIVNYEQKGEDRALYGNRILQSLAERCHNDGLSYRNLRLYRQFYQCFTELGECIGNFLLSSPSICQP